MENMLEHKLDLILAKVESLESEHKFRQQMWDEFSPIIKLMMNSGSEKLQMLEDRGYVDFLKGLMSIADEVMSNYKPEDLENLAKSVVGILDTIQSLTQDDVLTLANEAAQAIHTADKTKPLGVRGILKATRDDDVRRGIGMMMQLLRHVGKGAKTVKFMGANTTRPKRFSSSTIANPKHDKLAAMLAPKRRTATGEVCVVAPSKADPGKPVTECVQIDGVEVDAEGFLVNRDQWTEELAIKIAKQMGYHELTDAHWELIRFCRSESMAKHGTPNMRKLCMGCNVTAKHVFTLFPHAPAKTIAKIAGASKPVGCI